MKFTVKKKTLIDAITTHLCVLKSGAKKHQVLSIEAYEDGKITCIATDLHTSVFTEFIGDVERPGIIVVNGKMLYKMISNVQADEIAIEKLKSCATFTAHDNSFALTCISEQDYPQVLFYEDSQYINMDAVILKEAFESVVFSASKDKNYPAICGVQIIIDKNILQTAATDGNIMALSEYTYNGKLHIPDGIIIPKNAVEDIIKLLKTHQSIGIYYDNVNKMLGVKCGNTKLTIKLIDKQFPPVKKVIPMCNGNEIIMKKKELLKALKHIHKQTKPIDNGIVMDITPGHIAINTIAANNDTARTEIEAAYNGEPMRVGIRSRMFASAIEHCNCDKIILHISSPISPIAIRPTCNNTYLIVMTTIRIE